ncbi:mobilization protein [Streptomyces griseoaurantiacus]|uniref:mobilization protein n=1 Tax=Streptomyces griseoaurantiacus TaxID=68213 RepID=UPI00352DD52D
MNPNVTRGSRTYGLLAYLYGPGRHNEHTDPHLVASWDGFAPDPGRDPEATVKHLATALDLRVKQVGDRAPAKHVWHCSVRTAPEDRRLSDSEWNMVARQVLHHVGIARDDDTDACRWVAVRHADDHIHIAATLVRGDLRRARIDRDWPKAQAACRLLEKQLGLRRLNPGDGTAAKRATAAERHKAERAGHAETPRDQLRSKVRQALAAAGTETEFFDGLADAGLRVKLRRAPSGDVLGYSVALPGDHNADGDPVWFAGATLAPDLSLPRLRRRLDAVAPDEPGQRLARPERSQPAAARRGATTHFDAVLVVLDRGEDRAADDLSGVAAVIDALAATSAQSTRAELLAAAGEFERAARSHVRAAQGDRRALHTAARRIMRAGNALGRGEDGDATAMLLSTLVLTALAIAHWHAERGHTQQATAARQTATHLRAAYRQAAATPMRRLRQQATHIPAPARRRYDIAIRTALAASDRVAQGPMPALAATLAAAEAAGHAPDALLRQAVGQRELATADSVEDVLVWRVRRLTDLPAAPVLTTAVKQRPPTPEAQRQDIPTVTESRRPPRPPH